MTGPHRRSGPLPLARTAAIPAAVTVLVFLPEFLLLPDALTDSGWLRILWLVVLLAAAPVAAWRVNRASPVAVHLGPALLAGLPQLVLLPVLIALDIRLDVMRGYLLAGTGEEQMAYGFGLTLAVVLGLVLTGLVATAGYVGARGAPVPAPAR